MTSSVRYALLFSLAIAARASAQTVTTPGSITNNGVVTLGNAAPSATTTSPNPAIPVQSTAGATTGTTTASGATFGNSSTNTASTVGGIANTGSSGATGTRSTVIGAV